MPTGRRGRVTGTYEKSVTGLPYIIAYAIIEHGGEEAVAMIVRVIHTSRHWPAETWPEWSGLHQRFNRSRRRRICARFLFPRARRLLLRKKGPDFSQNRVLRWFHR